MSKVCVVLALLMLSMVAIGYAQEPGPEPGPAYPQNGDPWNYVPQPSGMQFASEGNHFGGSDCGCNTCVHWTQVSWYATWPNYGWPEIHRKHCGGCRSCCYCR